MNRACECVFKSYNKDIINQLKIIKDRIQRSKDLDDLPKEQKRLEALNLLDLIRIFESYGYPNNSIVGIKYEHYAVDALLNSSLKTMEKYYDLVLKSADNNLLDKRHLATLYDKIEMLNGRPQKYGTQQIRDASGELKMFQVKDKSQLAALRKSMNLKTSN